jgi:hypothetical protein
MCAVDAAARGTRRTEGARDRLFAAADEATTAYHPTKPRAAHLLMLAMFPPRAAGYGRVAWVRLGGASVRGSCERDAAIHAARRKRGCGESGMGMGGVRETSATQTRWNQAKGQTKGEALCHQRDAARPRRRASIGRRGAGAPARAGPGCIPPASSRIVSTTRDPMALT